MKYNEEFLHEFLKVSSQNRYREKLKKEKEKKKEIEKIKKEMLEKEKALKIELKKENNSKPKEIISINSEEKDKIRNISELIVHSDKGIQKTSTEFNQPFNPLMKREENRIFIKPQQVEGNLTPILTPKNTNAEKILEVPLPPSHLIVKTKTTSELKIPSQNLNQSMNKILMPDFGKINSLILDKDVNIIQCDGENLPIKINRLGKIETTNISLEENEIYGIIRKFADRINKEITKPVFKAEFNNLELVAISSSFSGSRFVITKK